MKLKTVVPDFLAVIGALLPVIFKRKKFVLWYEGPDRKPYLLSHFVILREGVNPGPGFIKKSSPMSFRQCEKTRDALWMLGP